MCEDWYCLFCSRRAFGIFIDGCPRNRVNKESFLTVLCGFDPFLPQLTLYAEF